MSANGDYIIREFSKAVRLHIETCRSLAQDDGRPDQ